MTYFKNVTKDVLFHRRTPLVYHRAYFGSGTQRINWSGVKCNGTELNIFLCHHGGEYTLACGHSDDVGIDCQQGI